MYYVDHACKESNVKCSSFMELLKHVAKQHFKESDDESERKVQNKVVENENENRDVKRVENM